MRCACVVLALVQTWISRGILDPDGVSYSDLAKALLAGDWRNGLSSYWSPLYSWFLVLGYAVFRPGIHWLIFVSHVVNFLAFVCALLAWEWLLREWERWQGPPAHRPLVESAGYTTIALVGLHTVWPRPRRSRYLQRFSWFWRSCWGPGATGDFIVLQGWRLWWCCRSWWRFPWRRGVS
jgi:hypothetical protein